MAFKHIENEYAIPRGRVYFEPLGADGKYKGERALGNTPSVTLNITATKAEHFSSETKASRRDRNRTVRQTIAGKLVVDNLDTANRAMFLNASIVTATQTQAEVEDEEIDVVPGLFYQLGRTESNPLGARMVSGVVLKPSAAGSDYVLGTDYEVDPKRARIQILPTGSIPAGKIKADYIRAAATWERIQTGDDGEAIGRLRIVSDMVDGKDRDHYMPSVTLSPTGDLSVISSEEEYIQAEFDLDVLEGENEAALYCDGMPITA